MQGDLDRGGTQSDGGPSFVADEVVIEFAQSAANAPFMRDLPSYAAARHIEPVPVPQTGIEKLDEALLKINVRALYVPYDRDRAAKSPTLYEPMMRLVIVRFDRATSVSEAMEVLWAVNGDVRGSIIADMSVHGTSSPSVVPNDECWPSQWGPPSIRCPDAWDLVPDTGAITVAVLDTGIDRFHKDLVARQGKNFLHPERGNNVQDEHGHGTLMSGILGAIANNGTDIAGVAWRCRLLPVLVSGNQTPNAILAEGILWASGPATLARILNVSYETAFDDLTLSRALKSASESDVLVVAAMGNAGAKGNPVLYPAAYAGQYANVVAVGSIDQAGRPAADTCTGSWMTVAAPGVEIITTRLGTPKPEPTTIVVSGTSCATAMVSGVAAMILTKEPHLTAPELKRRLMFSARPPSGHSPGDLPSPEYGWGIVDAWRSLVSVSMLWASRTHELETQRIEPAPTAPHAYPTIRLGSRPAVAVQAGERYVAWRAETDDQVWTTHMSGSAPEPAKQKAILTKAPPALATFRSEFVLAWQANDGSQVLCISSSKNPLDFSKKRDEKNITLASAPAMVEFNGELYIAWRGTDTKGYLSHTHTRDIGNIPKGDYDENHRVAGGTAPAMAVFADRLIIAWQDAESRSLQLKFTQDGQSWKFLLLTDFVLGGSPTIAAYDPKLCKLWIAWPSARETGKLWMTSFDHNFDYTEVCKLSAHEPDSAVLSVGP